MIILLSIDRINGKHINKARVRAQKPLTPARLATIHKRELKKLYDKHPELSDSEKSELGVYFQYREEEINPDPRFMPKPLCFWCQSPTAPNLTGHMKCSCGREWYDWRYDLNKFMK